MPKHKFNPVAARGIEYNKLNNEELMAVDNCIGYAVTGTLDCGGMWEYQIELKGYPEAKPHVERLALRAADYFGKEMLLYTFDKKGRYTHYGQCVPVGVDGNIMYGRICNWDDAEKEPMK